MKMKIMLGLICIVGGFALSLYLSIYVMLYGGIMMAVNNSGVDNSAVVWGIIRAVCFEFGLIPGAMVVQIGSFILTTVHMR